VLSLLIIKNRGDCLWLEEDLVKLLCQKARAVHVAAVALSG